MSLLVIQSDKSTSDYGRLAKEHDSSFVLFIIKKSDAEKPIEFIEIQKK